MDINQLEQQFQESLKNVSDEIKMAVQAKQQIQQLGLASVSLTNKENYVRISIETPEYDERNSCDIVCVLDVSGSMATEASVKNKDGKKESDGLSYLDLLKHAVKTTILNLNEKDRFCLISYSDLAKVEFNINYMTEENKLLALNSTDNLRNQGSTNIWAGLQMALQTLKNNEIKSQHQSIILLTDGEPNVYPPLGLIPQLENYKQQNGAIPQINTFALGKAIDTPLLDSYAYIGGGQYCFIPCPGFIGTIFVNSISNILSTTVSKCEINIEPLNGCQIEKVFGYDVQNNNNIYLGDVKQGQPRDCLLKINIPDEVKQQNLPYMNLQLKYYDYKIQGFKIGEVKQASLQPDQDPLVDASFCRLSFCEKVKLSANKFRNDQVLSQQIIADLKKEFLEVLQKLETQEYQIQDQESQEFLLFRNRQAQKFIQGIIKDVEKEVTLAVGREESYQHWGQHFLFSLIHCHLKQQCNNFCDPGIQGYGGKFFSQIKDQVADTFIKLPAPKPSKKQVDQNNNNQQKKKRNKHKKNNHNQQYQQQQQQHQQQQYQQQQQQQQQQQVKQDEQQIDMNYYYNAGGGCFEGNCLVQMFDNTQVKVKDIRKGFKVKSLDNQINTVIAVIKVKFDSEFIPLVELQQGLLITPSHPILKDGKWIKPQQIKKPQLFKCDTVYNFILDKGHTMQINNVTCVTLGHGFEEKNTKHDYFGTNSIIEDLKKFKSFITGVVEIENKQFLRDRITQKICGLTNFY